MGWLTGYGHRKSVTITGQTGAGTLYQVDLSIAETAGGDFTLDSHALAFPNDIRFTDNDETTELDYWIEDLTVDPITAWVEVADSLESNVDIYCYYGKTGDTTTSNGDNTFLFFDGAESGAITDKWTGGTANTVYSTDRAFSGSKSIKMDSVTQGGIVELLHTMAVSGTIVEIEMYDDGDTSLHQAPHPGSNSQMGIWTGQSTTYYSYNSGGWTTSSILRTVGWHNLKWVHDGTTMKQFIDGTQLSSYAFSPANIILNSGVDTYLGVSYYDNVLVRKYASPEPAFSSAGAEENFAALLRFPSGRGGGIGEAMKGGIAR